MKKFTKRWQLLLYGCSGLGVNMLNLIVGTYLCSALLTGGFSNEDIGLWTYGNENRKDHFEWKRYYRVQYP